MATLQTIRTKAGLLVAIVIGISLAAFILGDMFQGGSSMFQGDRMEVGEIDGESVQYPQFQQEVEELGEIYRMNNPNSQLDEETWVQVRNQAWENMVRNQVMGSVYEDLGITVSSDELFDMLQGTNLHPIIQQLFADPNTGQVDRNAVVNFLRNLETGVSPEQRDYWLYLENQILEERIQTKYNNLVGKGLYVTSEEARQSAVQNSKQVDFDYIMLAHNTVADSQVVVAEKDLRNYYNNNQDEFEQEKQRRIEYVTFPVEPTNRDYQEAEDWINDIVSDFSSASDNVSFVNSNSDVVFDNSWYKQEELPAAIADWIFETEAEVGDIFGPYFENEAYKLAKLHASEMMPDSVEARHILLQFESQEQMTAMQELADSLKTAIDNGSDFAELARQYSADQGSAVQGGDLGWFGRGQMVGPFEEAAFTSDINEAALVNSQFGIHLVQPTDRGELSRQVQVAYLVRNVSPSTQTYQDVYREVSSFAGENTSKEKFDSAVTEQDINKQAATLSETDRRVGVLANARALVRATFESRSGEIIQDSQGSTIFELGDNFVVATLVSATEEGVADFDNVKERIERAVLKEKKAEFLTDKIQTALEGNSDLEALASELGATVRNAPNINFRALQLPGAGMEPAVIGTATSMEAGNLSGPVAGNNGVFVVKVNSVNEEPVEDIENERMRLAQDLTFRVSSQAFTAHREKAEIEDNRAKFY